MSLDSNAKLYMITYPTFLYVTDPRENNNANTAAFRANTADYGGAVYVDDDTNSGACASDPKTECFFQVLAIHSQMSRDLNTQAIHFSNNKAYISGSTLY